MPYQVFLDKAKQPQAQIEANEYRISQERGKANRPPGIYIQTRGQQESHSLQATMLSVSKQRFFILLLWNL
jgi:hypothetical protein